MTYQKSLYSLFLFCLFGCCNTTYSQLPDSLSALFTYNRSAPFHADEKMVFSLVNPQVSLYDLKDSSKKAGPYHVKVRLIAYDITDSVRGVAWITEPQGQDRVQKRPLLVFQHWGEGNKDQFLAEAVEYSQKGFVCFLPDAIFLLPHSPYTSYARHGLPMLRTGVINIQRGLDYLQQQYAIDPAQLYFVGHSHGASIGSILTALEPRFQHFILLTGLYRSTEALRNSNRPDVVQWKKQNPTAFNDWLQWMRVMDADLYLAHKTKPVYLQLATEDEFIPAPLFKELEAKTKSPKKVTWYRTRHALNAKAKEDRMQYIMGQWKP